MSDLPELDRWEEQIIQIDTDEFISGGVSGVANRALKLLTNRTKYLHKFKYFRQFHISEVGDVNIDLEECGNAIVYANANNAEVSYTFSNSWTHCRMVLVIYNGIAGQVTLPPNFFNHDGPFGIDCSTCIHNTTIFYCHSIDHGIEWLVDFIFSEDVILTQHLFTWGDNAFNQMGVDTGGAPLTAPTQLNDELWKSVNSAESHTLALKEDGTLWGWGRNWNQCVLGIPNP